MNDDPDENGTRAAATDTVGPPSQNHPVATALAVVLKRLNGAAPASVMVGRAASPSDDNSAAYFAWVRVPDGLVIDIDEIEAMALGNAGAHAGEVPRCPACGEVANYGSPIDIEHDAWSCVDDGPFIYAQGRADRAPDAPSAPDKDS